MTANNTRWNWMAGSMAAASAAAANAATVQITQIDNQISDAANTLNADLTTDGVPDLLGLFYNASTGYNFTFTSGGKLRKLLGQNFVRVFSGSLWIGGATYTKTGLTYSSPMGALTNSFSANYSANFGPPYPMNSTPQNEFNLFPVTFTDFRINDGAPTNGFLDVNAFNTSPTSHTVRLVRLVFDDASTVAPFGVTPGGTDPAWVDPKIAEVKAMTIATLRAKCRKIRKAIRKAKTNGKKRRLKKRLKKCKMKLRALN